MILHTWLHFVVKRGYFNSAITHAFRHMHFSLKEGNEDEEGCSFLLRIFVRSHNVPLAWINHLHLPGFQGVRKLWCLFIGSSKNRCHITKQETESRYWETTSSPSHKFITISLIFEQKSVFYFPPPKEKRKKKKKEVT